MSAEQIDFAEELRAGRPLIVSTVGTSMQPLLHQGETRVVLVPLSDKPQKGDVLLYRRPTGEYVLHRAVRTTDGVCWMRGDHCYEPLERVEPKQLLGVAQAVIRKDGSSFPVTAPLYRLYVMVWLGSYPLRCALNFVRHPRSKLRAFRANRTKRSRG